MRIDNPTLEQKAQVFAQLDKRARKAGKPVFIKYLDLGTHTIRLINHSAAFTHHIEMQLDWSLKDDAPHYDTTLVIWQEKDVTEVALTLFAPYDRARYRQLRVQKMARRQVDYEDMVYFDEEIWRHHPIIEVYPRNGSIAAWNPQTNTHYYSVENLEPEEFIKHGHIFVQTFSKILKSPTSNLAHGAVVGLQGKGVLLCGIGYRGKSTFSVNALLDGFDYVSDDYLVLSREDETLKAWPIYSIITLSPSVYQRLHTRLQAKFVSNNARKDKYVFNISAYHDKFVGGYPVKLCMYPTFSTDSEPSIVLGNKDLAVQELVMSTVRQMGDAEDVMTIGKLYSFVEKLPFYRINLTKNIDKNTRCLREFLENFG